MDKATKIGLFKSLLLARVFEEKKTEWLRNRKNGYQATSCIGQKHPGRLLLWIEQGRHTAFHQVGMGGGHNEGLL